MSGGNHPDLDRFYEALEAGEDLELGDDEDDDGFDLYLDEIDEIIDEDDDDDEFYDEDDDDEDEEDDDEDGEEGMDLDNGDQDDDDEDDDDEDGGAGGDTWLNLAELLNSAGGTVEARSSLLARLLAGPVGTRSGGGTGTRFRPVQTAEERAKAMAERRKKERWWKPQTEPSPRGVELLNSGEFGRVGEWRRRKGTRQPGRRERLVTRAQVRFIECTDCTE